MSRLNVPVCLEVRGSIFGRRCREIGIWGLVIVQLSVGAPPVSYYPAVYESAQDSGRLIVFPLNRSKYFLPVPGLHGGVVYGSDGRTVYVTTAERREIPGGGGRLGTVAVPGLFKVDLESGHVAAISGSTEFLYILAFAVSQRQDRVVVSGHRWSPGHDTCGLYMVSVPNGEVDAVFASSNCDKLPYGAISLAPDGKRAVTVRGGRLDILDLVSGSDTPWKDTGDRFWRAEWSPDGKWIAALALTGGARGNDGGSRTVLLDPSDPARRRDFDGNNDKEAVWSPDSRSLLHAVWSPRPKPSVADCLTLETLDIDTGRRQAIETSRCQLSSNSIGWISSDLLPLGSVAPSRK